MKSTGIVRRVDDLGRVGIPKEILRALRIREGNLLELYVGEGGVLFRKYKPFHDLKKFSEEYVNSMFAITGCSVIITDRDTVLAIAGAPRGEFVDKTISDKVTEIIDRGHYTMTQDSEGLKYSITENGREFSPIIIVPIVSEGDGIGSVILFSYLNEGKYTDTELQVAQVGANLLGKTLEDWV